MEVKLKPCPYCGGEAEFRSQFDQVLGRMWFIRCNSCHARSDLFAEYNNRNIFNEIAVVEKTWQDAAEAWNRRTSDDGT